MNIFKDKKEESKRESVSVQDILDNIRANELKNKKKRKERSIKQKSKKTEVEKKESKKVKKLILKKKEVKQNKSNNEIWDIYKHEFNLNLPNRDFFEKNINLLEKLNRKELYVISQYKGVLFYTLNRSLITKKLPFIIDDSYGYSFKELNFNKIRRKKDNGKEEDNDKIKMFYPEDIQKIKDKYTDSFIKAINILDNSFYKMNNLEDIVLYRGLHKTHNTIKNKNNKNKSEESKLYEKFHELSKVEYDKDIDYKKGELVKNNAYLSTSLNPLIALGFSHSWGKESLKTIIKMNIKKEHNVPFIFLTDKMFSYYRTSESIKKILKNWNKTLHDEFEILLPRNFEFKVISKKIMKIRKRIEGFNSIFDKEKYEKVLVYEVESLPYQIPDKVTSDYFIQKIKYVCF